MNKQLPSETDPLWLHLLDTICQAHQLPLPLNEVPAQQCQRALNEALIQVYTILEIDLALTFENLALTPEDLALTLSKVKK